MPSRAPASCHWQYRTDAFGPRSGSTDRIDFPPVSVLTSERLSRAHTSGREASEGVVCEGGDGVAGPLAAAGLVTATAGPPAPGAAAAWLAPAAWHPLRMRTMTPA